MYIAPNSTIALLRGVPLDKRYSDTLYFASDSAQHDYFYSKRKMVFTKEMYNRVGKGRCRVHTVADNLYDCNYMMFQNTAYGAKWFYAFIDRVEYVNDSVTEVIFTIDPLQTWLGEIRGNLGQCYVVRCHSSSDNIGENTVPEGVETGELVLNDYGTMPVEDDGQSISQDVFRVFISVMETGSGTTPAPDPTDPDAPAVSTTTGGKLYDGVFGGTTLKVYASTNITDICTELDKHLAAPGNVVSMYMAPSAVYPTLPDDNIVPSNADGPKYHFSLPAITANDTLNGYTPKNKKLYTYPYNYAHVDNGNGQTMALPYEFFDNLTPDLVYYGTITAPVQICVKPENFKGTTGPNHNQCLMLSNFPMCSWATDSFSAWLAQNTIDLPERGTTGGTFARMARSVLTGPAGPSISALPASAEGKTLAPTALMSILSNPAGAIQSLLGQAYQASIAQDISSGSFSSGGANTAARYQRFYSGRVSVKAEYARLIDDFFTAYGYAQNKLMVPPIANRPGWCYVQTRGAVLLGNMPADDKSDIAAIFDNGIRFWKNPAAVGDYSGNNSPS